MKQSKRNVWWSVCAGLLFCSWGCSSRVSDKPVTLETLLDDINQLNVALLLDRLDTYGSEDFKVDKDEEFSEQWKVLLDSREEYYKKASKVLLKDL